MKNILQVAVTVVLLLTASVGIRTLTGTALPAQTLAFNGTGLPVPPEPFGPPPPPNWNPPS